MNNQLNSFPKRTKKFFESLDYVHCTLFLVTWSLSIYGYSTTYLQTKTLAFSILFIYMTGMGVTCGYHRLWAHKSYDATNLYKIFILFCASGAVQGSCKWWSRNHRLHHRYTDTDFDPYSAHKGLLWSHIGWMIFKPDPRYTKRIDIEDLKKDPLVQFQHKYYGLFALSISFLFPTLVCGLLWGDYRGGFFYAGVIRLVALHNMTFSINSLAHYMGDQPFDDRLTPRDNLLTAFLTFGEGYHNFHHEFPGDYRNGIRRFDYDPSKWFIKLCSYVGLTYNLKQFEDNEVLKGKFQMQVKKLVENKKAILWPKSKAQLPYMTRHEFDTIGEKHGLVIFEGIVHKVAHFVPDHPGGQKLLESYIGKDITKQFKGGVYRHSNAAENLLAMMRFAKIREE